MAARRPYNSERRARQAAQTKADVLAAATRLFAETGWTGTGMREVAKAAGVSVETVYAHFRSKSELLIAVLEVTIVGDAEPVPLRDRPEFAPLVSGPREERIAAAAALLTNIHRRTADVHLALRQGALADADLARRLHDSEEGRRTELEWTIPLVIGRQPTATERDGLWAVLSLEVYRMLTAGSGWTAEQYEQWVAHAMDRLLDDQ